MKSRARFSPRRRGLLAVVLVLMALVGWASWTGMAITRGVETRDMDWNADGTVEHREILQAFYAVTATRVVEGNRECTTFRWYRGGEAIRVDCRTVFEGADAE
ncbi:MAG TPA: hypothetical protein VFF91_11210 [Pseudoxanthomonas sp.]|nr:hypothetical protein [Pseudoxanthomonas sp.]